MIRFGLANPVQEQFDKCHLLSPLWPGGTRSLFWKLSRMVGSRSRTAVPESLGSYLDLSVLHVPPAKRFVNEQDKEWLTSDKPRASAQWLTNTDSYRHKARLGDVGGDAPRLPPASERPAAAALLIVVLLVRQNARPSAEASQSLKLRVFLLLVEKGNNLRIVQPP